VSVPKCAPKCCGISRQHRHCARHRALAARNSRAAGCIACAARADAAGTRTVAVNCTGVDVSDPLRRGVRLGVLEPLHRLGRVEGDDGPLEAVVVLHRRRLGLRVRVPRLEEGRTAQLGAQPMVDPVHPHRHRRGVVARVDDDVERAPVAAASATRPCAAPRASARTRTRAAPRTQQKTTSESVCSAGWLRGHFAKPESFPTLSCCAHRVPRRPRGVGPSKRGLLCPCLPARRASPPAGSLVQRLLAVP